MDLETVQAYFQWASRALAQGGLLISFNAHDKAGVKRPSQYFQDGLSLVHMAPFRKVPAGWFNTIPYEMVFKHTGGMINKSLAEKVDIIGELIQLGLDGELKEVIAESIQMAGSASLLDELPSMFYPANEEERQQVILRSVLQGNIIIDFLAANYWYATGNMAEARRLLERCLRSGLDGFARTRAQAMLAAIGASVDWAAMLEGAAGLVSELEDLVLNQRVSGLQNHIARVMDCPVARVTPQERIARAAKRVLRKLVPTDSRSAS